jgi:hypothetical protein
MTETSRIVFQTQVNIIFRNGIKFIRPILFFANTILYNLLSLAISIYHHTTLAVMRKTFFFFYAFLLVVVSASAQVKLQNLLTENLTNPIGIDVRQPRFSWQLISDQRNVTQTAYEITVSSGKGNMWKSGKIMSEQSVHVP